MPRAFWKGTLSFGLVEIPVTLRPAVKSDEISFTMLDSKDFSPIGYKRFNKRTGREVAWEQIVRGYEYEADEYVVLSDEELRRVNPEATQTIEIEEFVDESEVDPVFFDTPYFVEPTKKGSKGYLLLVQALERSGKMGIARLVLRTRQRLAAVLVRRGVLLAVLLRYAHELQEPAKIEPGPRGRGHAGTVSEKEVKLAEQLIEGMSDRWAPAKFRDEYFDDVMALVRRKVKAGQTHEILEPEEPEKPRKAGAEVVDLMPLLRESLESRGKRRRSAAGARARSGRRTGGEDRRRRAS